MADNTYTSPIEKRVQKHQLTTDLLRTNIPLVHQGMEAELELAEGSPRGRRVTMLRQQVRTGETAKETIVEACLPLMNTIVNKEQQRRNGRTQGVTREDLIQEATIGLLKGLAAFNVDAINHSATNYLGQWMLVEIRRSSSVLDHDLRISHELNERYTKIRAITSRLYEELGREPTPQEISDASHSPEYSTNPNKFGAYDREAKKPTGFTVEQVEDEQIYRTQYNNPHRIDQNQATIDGTRDNEWIFANLGEASSSDNPEEHVINETQSRVIVALIEQTLALLKTPVDQKTIISLRFGLPPYPHENSIREVARITGIHRDRVSKTVTAFLQEISTPHSAFHTILHQLPNEDLHAIGLDSILRQLGDWDERKALRHKPAKVLQDTFHYRRPRTPQNLTTKKNGYIAYFVCPYHFVEFTGFYRHQGDIPVERACPRCDTPAPRNRLEEFTEDS